MEHLTEQTSQIARSLGRDVVEITAMPNTMHDSKEQSGKGNDLVEGHSSIEWNVLIEGGLPEEGDEVPGHRQQQYRIGPHHGRCSTTCNRDTISSNTT